MGEHFKKHILLYVLWPLFLMVALISFDRFMILGNFIVSYEGECDPETESCYVDCVDDECTEEYYFTLIYRPEREIEALCGPDITDCPAANSCQNSPDCELFFCDPETEGDACEDINISNL